MSRGLQLQACHSMSNFVEVTWFSWLLWASQLREKYTTKIGREWPSILNLIRLGVIWFNTKTLKSLLLVVAYCLNFRLKPRVRLSLPQNIKYFSDVKWTSTYQFKIKMQFRNFLQWNSPFLKALTWWELLQMVYSNIYLSKSESFYHNYEK